MRYPNMSRRMALLAAGVVASVVLIACGRDSGDDVDTPTAAPGAVRATATRPVVSPTSAPASPAATTTEVAIATISAPAVEDTPTPAPQAQNTPVPPPPPANTQVPPPPAGVTVYIKAVTTAFSPSSATVPAGATVTLTFDNQDEGVMHDFVLYGSGASSVIASTTIAMAPDSQTITFTLQPGQYAFKCSVHPREMNGAITAQ